MEKLCEKELKSISGGNPVAFIAGALVGGAVYDFAQGFVEGARDSNKRKK